MVYQYLKNEEAAFVCPNCGITRKRQNTMHYHMKQCTEKTHVCRHCDSEFIMKHSLDIHIQTEHPEHVEVPLEKHHCPYKDCKYVSFAKGNTRVHYIRVHCKDMVEPLQDKKNSCIECKKQFASQPAFIYHTPYCMKLLSSDIRVTHLQEFFQFS